MIRTVLPLLCLPLPALAEINVVADIAPIHSLTAQIMGSTGSPSLILPATADPHDFAFRPSDAMVLQDADLVIMIGPTLTPWLADPVETLASSAAHLVLVETKGWTALEMRSEHDHGHGDHNEHGDEGHDDHDDHGDEGGAEHDDHDDHDDEDHDDHDEHKTDTASVDPHGWMDPTIASVWAASIADALATADPDNAATYQANLATVQADLAALDARYATQLSDAGTFLWPHDGYQYVEVHYGLDAKGSIADVNASTPGPARVQALIDLVAAEDISCILTDREINGDWATLVSNDSNAGTAFIDGNGGAQTPGPDLYEDMMDTLITALADC